MDLEMITLLKHEYEVSPGAYFHVHTPWIHSPKETKTIIIDQDHVFTKMLTIYPNYETGQHFFMFLEQGPDKSLYRTNFPLTLDTHHDFYTIDFT